MIDFIRSPAVSGSSFVIVFAESHANVLKPCMCVSVPAPFCGAHYPFKQGCGTPFVHTLIRL